MNPKFHKYFMDVALRTAELSYAVRAKVGAVAVRDRRIVACGYNGTSPGEDNCCEYKTGEGVLKTLPNVIHAEDNLVRFAAWKQVDLRGCTLYVTHKPCINCAKIVHKAGIFSVIYLLDYGDNDGDNYLRQNYCIVEKLKYD